jgi:hypothetical protein
MTAKATIGIDGLIRIAEAAGLVAYSTVIGDGAEGLTAACTLHLADSDEVFTATMNEATEGRRPNGVWLLHPRKMLELFTLRKAIHAHFKDAIEAAEKSL